MRAEFVHLHVASSYSMQYGASSPARLVEAAAADEQRALALTDRDGLYGAIRFARACADAGVAPILGVDLAVEPPPGDGTPLIPGGGSMVARGCGVRRSPARGGLPVDDRLPRITVLARGAASGMAPGQGWAALCRLVTATHLRGERGRPVTSVELVAEHAQVRRAAYGPGESGSAGSGGSGGHRGSQVRRGLRPGRSGSLAGYQESAPGSLVVLLGPDSDVGRAVLARRWARAEALLRRWVSALPTGSVVIELTCHDGPPDSPGSAAHCGALARLGIRMGLPLVLTAAVRHVEPGQAVVADLLDAARRLVPLAQRHLDRTTTAGHLASAKSMYAVARRLAGDDIRARELLRETVALGIACIQHPRDDLSIGGVHLPEPTAIGLAPGVDPQRVLAERCRAAVPQRYAGAEAAMLARVADRLDDELAVIATLGYPTYFLTVATVVDLIRDRGVRVAARGSGAGSMVNYLLGISGVEPLAHDLLMERFCTPLRAQLPDIDIDTESARRTEIYEAILARFGGARVTCVSMMETYKVRHAIRDVGAALGLPPPEIDQMAKAFPHIRARDARHAIAELPELAASGYDSPRLARLFELVEALDGLPRHIALHPCGVILSDAGLLDRTPVEASWLGFPMSQFDKDDVEAVGLLKLDVLGVRMQSAMAHAVAEIARVEQERVDLEDRTQVPLDDPATFDLIRSTRTLGCFQIESPGQRELIGKFAPETFDDLVIDISLFRPGPVKSDMVTPFLRARQGWEPPDLIHPSLTEALAPTWGVVVFHEQVLRIIAVTTGISLAEADEVRRAMGSRDGQDRVEAWWKPAARGRGYLAADIDRIWAVLAAFASFGFCKAHAAAFALPTYQSAWLKAHHPAAFVAGLLTHDPGMYPKRLILDDARNGGVPILGLDVNASSQDYRVERDETGRLGIRVALADVKGISSEEVARIVAGAPYGDLEDFWRRARVSLPVLERLVLAGAFDALYGLDPHRELGRRGRLTRRDLLLHVAELDRWGRAVDGPPGSSLSTRGAGRASSHRPARARGAQVRAPVEARVPARPDRATVSDGSAGLDLAGLDVAAAAAGQSQAPAPAVPAAQRPRQLVLDLGDAPVLTPASGLPEFSDAERIRAELDILGMDVSAHVLTPYAPMLADLGAVRSSLVRDVRSRAEILVAGVKVATQTPPIRSGRRVVFLTLDDGAGPVDATFFEDVQGPYAATVFHSWLLVVRGVVRRTGPRGVSLRATGAWELSGLYAVWSAAGAAAVHEILAATPDPAYGEAAREGAAGSRSTRPVMVPVPAHAGAVTEFGGRGAPVATGPGSDPGTRPGPRDDEGSSTRAGGMGGGRRVLVHASGFRQSPYADVRPPGTEVRSGRALAGAPGVATPADPLPSVVAGQPPTEPAAVPPRKLWHSSPGSSGH
ncbi:MAG: DNA polymerase III subunit alpha [Actinobacteria bacterium]|nr:DNA polymerase III subunit alpha [Actinomycetota bacterium]